MSTYDAAADADFLNHTLDELTKHVFYSDIGSEYTPELGDKELKKAAWASSVLAGSPDDEHQKKALATAVLLYITQDEGQRQLYRKFLYTVLSRLGSLPSAQSLTDGTAKEDVDSIQDFEGTLLDAELDAAEEYHRLDDGTVLTRFQQQIWNNLDKKYVVFSGPTSSGKSFLMRRYIEHRVTNDDTFQAIYLVPSRALISEVSADFREEIGDQIDVRTNAHLDDAGESFLLVLTPERCLQLFDYEQSDKVDIDLIFLDEIQQLEDGGRGPLFENVLENLESVWQNAQIIAAGPFIDNPSSALEEIVHGDASDIKTIFNPVFQLQARFTFRKYSDVIDVEVKSASGSILNLEVDRPTGLSYSTIKTNKKQTIRKFIETFGREDQSLVYAKSQAAAENMAEGIAESRSNQSSPETEGLLEYLRRSIHKEYALVDTIQRGVAFHHASVPQIARDEIENLYRNEELDTIACTSTLLQGVNLPAEKMYIIDPGMGRNKTLSDFELQNLIGRVGRVGSKLYGTIYYIDREDDEWSEGKLDKTVEKEVTSATSSALLEKQDELREKIATANTNEIDDAGLRYTTILLRNRYIKDRESVKPYLRQKGVQEREAEEIVSKLDSGLPKLGIPEKILKKNPTVDPVLQNRLYENVLSSPSPWEVETNNLRETFFQVTRRLNIIFNFVADPEEGIESTPAEETRAYNFNHLSYTAYHWLSERNYSEMIELRKQALEQDNINSVIKELMRIINTDVRYALVKYYKILCDILGEIDDYENYFMLNFDKRLERGSYDSGRLQLMDLGIDRSIALDLDVPESDDEDELRSSLREQMSQHSPVYRRHLLRNGVIPKEENTKE